ncbi:hypothetical protein [Tenacibaculum sp. 190524A05c]|uniref:MFS transporter n=1 Tax=Tenacibaculum platacis TaxID=3137852 RepID=A0ABM9P2G1_9FLAO
MNQKIRTAQLIHVTQIIGFCIFNYVLGDFKNLDKFKIEGSDFIYVLIPIVAYFLGLFISKKKLDSVASEQSISDKLTAYVSSFIMRWAPLEAAGFFILLVKPELINLNIGVLILLILIRPSKKNAKTVLHLRDSDFNS